MKSAQNSGFIDTQYELFQEKKISPLKRAIFQICGHKTIIRKETAHNIAKCLFLNVLRILFPTQSYRTHIKFFFNLKNHCTLLYIYYILYLASSAIISYSLLARFTLCLVPLKNLILCYRNRTFTQYGTNLSSVCVLFLLYTSSCLCIGTQTNFS